MPGAEKIRLRVGISYTIAIRVVSRDDKPLMLTVLRQDR